ncbi:MAG: hypothetical protein QOJ08_2514 [Ilumatobacteraceae bacterium]
MKTEESLEIIEIIDDGIDPFGDRGASAMIYDSGGPRWVGPVAAVALVAFIAYGVATSATSGVPTVAPAPSTNVPTSTTPRPAPTTTIPPPLVPYYAADPPRPFSVQYADIQDVQRLFPRGDYQLWATPTATATSGSWFSIDSLRTGPQSISSTNAYRVQSGEQSLAISHTPGGQTTTQASISKVMSVTITSFGWSDENLVRLAQSITVSDASEGNAVVVGDPALTTGYQMLTSVRPSLALLGTPVEQVYYAAGSDATSFISINVAPRPPSNAGGSTLDRQIALRFFLHHSTPFEVDGHVATAGLLIGQQEESMATWIAGDHIVTLSAQIPVPELVAIAQTVHEVTAAEWEGMKFQATNNSNTSSDGGYSSTLQVPVSFGMDADGKAWTITASIAAYPNGIEVDWRWGNRGFGELTDDGARISTVAESDRTYVLAELPRAIAPTAQLQVVREGLDPVIVPFVDTDATLDRTLAAFAFSEPGPYSAQIIGADGSVLATWPSP